MDPIGDSNPKCDENTGEANNSESEATCFNPHSPQNSYEGVGSKYLVSRWVSNQRA